MSAIDAGYCLGYVSRVASSVDDCEGEHVTNAQELTSKLLPFQQIGTEQGLLPSRLSQ